MPKLSAEYNLLVTNPDLAREWHPTKNGGLKPSEVTPGSGKKVWWICKKEHSWEAAVSTRNKGHGCPYCHNLKVNKENCLATINPNLAKEWNYKKNGKLTPADITPRTTKKVWWICIKGHEWETSVSNRDKRGDRCPYCSGKIPSESYNLKQSNPDLADEWHPYKNNKLKPENFTPHSNKFAWWICKRNHEWKAKINSRNGGAGCPHCVSTTSEIEIFIFSEVKYYFRNTSHRKKVDGVECDVFIPELKLAIEYDGFYWHESRRGKDKEKNINLKTKGIEVLRIRENKLKKISRTDMFYSPRKENPLILTKKIFTFILSGFDINSDLIIDLRNYIERENPINTKYFKKVIDRLPYPLEGTSLAETNPELAMEWHPSKNGNMKPDHVTPNSHREIWWSCLSGHEWETSVAERNRGRGCPYCSGRRPSRERNLALNNPSLAKEWHPKLNGILKPELVTPSSSKSVWWICDKGHEWEAIVSSRSTGVGCPYCAGQKVSEDNCLAKINPDLSKEWHPNKNRKLTPEQVMPNSHKKIWWQCKKKHEWEAPISIRNRGGGCPYCSNRRVNKENSLKKLNPALAKEWHPSKNYFSPKDVIPGSPKKAWWKCKKGHEWEAVIRSRDQGCGCPYCTGQLASKTNNLAIINPALSKEWLHSKNKGVRPDQVLPGSNKKAWWICSKGHEWQATVSQRNRGSGCPYCSGRRASRENCLASKNPELASEWNIQKNVGLGPENVTANSGKKVWWICHKGHEWMDTVSHRSSGRDCPYCSGRRISKDNNLLILNPVLSIQWNQTRNGNLKPYMVTPNSHKKVWWLCNKGHEWEAHIYSRNSGIGCPYCSGKKIGSDNSLAKINPHLAKEWHQTNNRKLSPKEVAPNSHKKAWCVIEDLRYLEGSWLS